MTTTLSIQAFKELSEAERKKVTKDVLVRLLLDSNEPAELSYLKEAIVNLTDIVKEYKNQQEENSIKIVELYNLF